MCKGHSFNVALDYYGPYVWVAGQREDPSTRSQFVWRIRGEWDNDYDCPMYYENWTADFENNPDFATHEDSNPESCINVWPQYNYGWHDEPCEWEHCFVCEYRALEGSCPEDE